VNYGGVFDLFYKLPALQQAGVKIHLHCFDYGRGEQPVLNQYCENVYYYKRKEGLEGFSLQLPYIVSSRKNIDLLGTLLKDDYPILMEGIHCTYLLNDDRFANRTCFVRLHNVEHTYYKNLYKNSSSPLKKAYYLWESKLLFKYERSIVRKAVFLPVIPKDGEVYKNLGCKRINYVPLFLPSWKVKSIEGKGTFCLYHGDLNVAENEKAAYWLLQEVFSKLEIPFVIAGKNPSSKLTTVIEKKNNTCIVANPTEQEMQDMIEKAHINIIPSFNNTGIKLKLINALFNGRHCLVNPSTVEGTNLERACVIAEDGEDFKASIQTLFQQPFTSSEVEIRHQLLDTMFDNKVNAKQMIEIIWNSA